jgi:plasmid stability protein
MKNITITLDEETARLTRVRAAERDMSVSRYVGELLRKDIRESREYEDAMQRYLSRGPFKELTGPPQPYATREELHDRETNA